MISFQSRKLTVFVLALLLAFFVGCGEDDDESPPPSSPTAAGTYRGIGNFGTGEQSVKLVIEESSGAVSGGHSPIGSIEAILQTLEGSISYGGETYSISGTVEDDSISITWTTAEGTWTLSGTWDDAGISGTTSGPGGTYDFIAYRQAAGTNNITGIWYGWLESTEGPDEGFLLGHLLQSGSTITGYLVTSFEETFTISEGSFQDPAIAISAADSSATPPVTMVAGGLLVTADSATGTYNFIWEGGSDAGTWNLVRSTAVGPVPPDTGDFSGILAVVYLREGFPTTVSAASVYWQIDGEGVLGATITIDDALLHEAGTGFYLTLPGIFTAVPGQGYTFSIFHPDHGHAFGTVHVPGDFTVTAPLPDAIVPVGEDLTVTFTESDDATFYTANLHVNAAFGVAEAPATLITLPGSGIQTPGDDVLEVEAVRGDYDRWETTHTGYFGLVGKWREVTVQ